MVYVHIYWYKWVCWHWVWATCTENIRCETIIMNYVVLFCFNICYISFCCNILFEKQNTQLSSQAGWREIPKPFTSEGKYLIFIFLSWNDKILEGGIREGELYDNIQYLFVIGCILFAKTIYNILTIVLFSGLTQVSYYIIFYSSKA